MRVGDRSVVVRAVLAWACLAGALGGCAADEAPAGSAAAAATATATTTATARAGSSAALPVAAAFYPIAEAVRRVGGDRVEVQNLTPPGAGPHDLELTPPQVEQLERARAIFYLSGGFQPAVEEAAAGLPEQAERVDVLDGIELLPVGEQLPGTVGEVDGEELADGGDPHVWVDPVMLMQVATTIRDTLAEIDPTGAEDYDRGLADYQDELGELNADFRSGLATCASRIIVTSHRAFEYLARRYGLVQIAIAGLSPDDEPDPRTVEAIAAAAERENVHTVFFEEQVPTNLAETVAREIGADTDALDPVETITAEDLADGASYTTVMRGNLDALRTGLGCR